MEGECAYGKNNFFCKRERSLRHNNREFIANNIDEARVPWNTVYIQKPLQEAYEEIFGNAVSEYNAKQKRSDRKIDDYLTKIKNSGNNEKQFYETVVQIGKRDDTGVLDENGNLSEAAKVARDILDEYARTFQERNPNLILFNAVLHMDEATPHLHLDEFKTFYQSAMKPAYDSQYPDEMRSDSRTAIDTDLNDSGGVLKLVDFARQWLGAN